LCDFCGRSSGCVQELTFRLSDVEGTTKDLFDLAVCVTQV